MAGIDPAAVPAFKDGMPRDQPPVLEDAHFGGMALHLQHALPGGVCESACKSDPVLHVALDGPPPSVARMLLIFPSSSEI